MRYILLVAGILTAGFSAEANPRLVGFLERFAGRYFIVETSQGGTLARSLLGRDLKTEADYAELLARVRSGGKNGVLPSVSIDELKRFEARLAEALKAGKPPLGAARAAARESGLSPLLFEETPAATRFFPLGPPPAYGSVREAFLLGQVIVDSRLASILSRDESALRLSERLFRGYALLARLEWRQAIALAEIELSLTSARASALSAAIAEVSAGSRDGARLARQAKILESGGFTRVERQALFAGGVLSRNSELTGRLARLGLDDEIRAGIARVLANDRKMFLPQFAARFEGRGMAALPDLDIPEMRSYRRILSVFEDPSETYTLIQELEAEVLYLHHREGIARVDALERVLTSWERAHGFKPVVELGPRAYASEELQAVLRSGAPFKDEGFGYFGHGRETHRIQLNLVMRDLRRNPAEYLRPDGAVSSAYDLYVTLGDPEVRIWGQLFDSKAINATRPDFLKLTKRLWPQLGDWR